jgi:hypothetical protein
MTSEKGRNGQHQHKEHEQCDETAQGCPLKPVHLATPSNHTIDTVSTSRPVKPAAEDGEAE